MMHVFRHITLFIARLCGLGVLCFGAPALAQGNSGQMSAGGTGAASQSTANLPINAQVTQSCRVVANPLHFGNVVGVGFTKHSTTTVSLRCTPGVNYSISLAASANNFLHLRRLVNSQTGSSLLYIIYQDAAHSQLWDYRSNARLTGTAGPTGIVTHTAYGRLFVFGNVAASSYHDSLIVSVDF